VFTVCHFAAPSPTLSVDSRPPCHPPFGVLESCLRRWVDPGDIDEGLEKTAPEGSERCLIILGFKV
jgi:hypothetical protein